VLEDRASSVRWKLLDLAKEALVRRRFLGTDRSMTEELVDRETERLGDGGEQVRWRVLELGSPISRSGNTT
jgi:hypothetical protein